MNGLRRSAWLLTLVLPLAVACSAPQPADLETKNPNHVNPTQAKMMVQEPATGHLVGPDGTIPGDQQGKKFSAGEKVIVAFKLADAPVGSEVRVDWYGPNDVKLASEAKKVAAPQTAMAFTELQTSGWNQGTYRAEIWIADQKVDTEQFSIVPADQGSATGNG
jgi:hypothetical protein